MTKNGRKRIIEKAYKAAVKAGQAKRAELEARGPAYEIYDADVLTGERSSGGKSYYMLDLCGLAWISMNGRSGLYRELKALYQAGDRRFYVGDARHVGVHAYSGQEVSCNAAAARAFAKALNDADAKVNARVWTRLD